MELLGIAVIVVIVLCVASIWWKKAKATARAKTIYYCRIHIKETIDELDIEQVSKTMILEESMQKVVSYIISNNIDQPSTFEASRLISYMHNTIIYVATLANIKQSLLSYFDIFDNTPINHINEIINRVAPILTQKSLDDDDYDDDFIVSLLEKADKDIRRYRDADIRRSIDFDNNTKEWLKETKDNAMKYSIKKEGLLFAKTDIKQKEFKI